MNSRRALGVFTAVMLLLPAVAISDASRPSMVIPRVREAVKRLVKVDDVARLRKIDKLTVSPDGRHFAILVRQGDPVANQYPSAWFIGDASNGQLTYAGDGGEVQPKVEPNGYMGGELEASDCRWSPNGRWIIYSLRSNGAVQLWRSRIDGSVQQQITNNEADVREFYWSADGELIYFRVGRNREDQRRDEVTKERTGYSYNEDIYLFTDFMKLRLMAPQEVESALWVVTPDGTDERLATAAEEANFARTQESHREDSKGSADLLKAAIGSPVTSKEGRQAWLVASAPLSTKLRLFVSPLSSHSQAMPCNAQQCLGNINKVWWSEDGQRVIIWRAEGVRDGTQAFYSWLVRENSISLLYSTQEDWLRDCSAGPVDQVICIRETPSRPAHVVSIDLRRGRQHELADVNPEFKNIRLGNVERFEWDTPSFPWSARGGKLHGLYSSRAFGYIIYPPDFDPRKSYPVFIDPYVAYGFNSSVGGEHAFHVYAANGFIVLNLSFPSIDDLFARLGAGYMKTLYSAEMGFPHLSMLSQSTLRGLDAAAAHGFIDTHRVGIGGVSHGTFVPLYIMQNFDRIAAISISSSTWGPHEYYWGTRKGREWETIDRGEIGYEEWRVKPEGEGQKFWSQFDIADHVEAVEAPVLMHLVAHETYGLVRFIRHLDDARKPYDAYVFPKETHLKWQPAHLQAIMSRNLDWFRFWLQGVEDPDASRSKQYQRWRGLRDQRYRSNGRSSSTPQ